MHIAICLYGQARNYKFGYECIEELMVTNKYHTIDVYFHCWIDDDFKYEISPWRSIAENTICIPDEDKVKKELLDLYKPVAHLYEKPLAKNSDTVLTDLEHIRKSVMYTNSYEVMRSNIYNTYSQVCSRTRVRDIFEKYISDHGVSYDTVLSTRLDGLDFADKLDFEGIDKDRIYTCSMRVPELIIPDNFLIIPPHIYVKWFNIYPNLRTMINDKTLEVVMENIKEPFIFGMEEVLLCNFFLCGYQLDMVKYVIERRYTGGELYALDNRRGQCQ
jgi:hypothetical protein